MKRKKRKITGEAAVFRKVWESRPHNCENCGAAIREPKAINFSHIKPKSQSPELRLDPENIRLLCSPCHYRQHSGGNVNWYLPE